MTRAYVIQWREAEPLTHPFDGERNALAPTRIASLNHYLQPTVIPLDFKLNNAPHKS
jgi:hypothetical protein